MSTVDSQCDDDAMPELVLVNTTFHETVWDAFTVTVVLVVSLITGEAAFVRVNVCVALRFPLCTCHQRRA